MKRDESTSLYRFFAADGSLLYVGITNHMPRRVTEHEGEKTWFGQVNRITVEHLPDRATALAAERAAIEREQPRFNIVHNARELPPEEKRAAWRAAYARGVTLRQMRHTYVQPARVPGPPLTAQPHPHRPVRRRGARAVTRDRGGLGVVHAQHEITGGCA